MSLKTTVAGLYKFTRAEITIAFVVPVVMLGIACAISTGLPIDWNNLALGACVIFFLIMISNGLNNIVDEKIDKSAMEAGSEKSRMYHILNIWEGLSRSDIISVVVLSGFVFGIALFVLASRAGYLVSVFALFGLVMALEYNLPPLKLAYRPFPELTMLLPSTVVAVIGMQYILVSQITTIAVCMGTAFGLFSAVWFLWQSMVDYDVDKEAGKKTTPVYVGPLEAGTVGIMYPLPGVALLIIASTTDLYMYSLAILGMVCMVVMSAIMIFSAPNCFKVWKGTMWATFLYGVVSALVIMFGGT